MALGGWNVRVILRASQVGTVAMVSFAVLAWLWKYIVGEYTIGFQWVAYTLTLLMLVGVPGWTAYVAVRDARERQQGHAVVAVVLVFVVAQLVMHFDWALATTLMYASQWLQRWDWIEFGAWVYGGDHPLAAHASVLVLFGVFGALGARIALNRLHRTGGRPA